MVQSNDNRNGMNDNTTRDTVPISVQDEKQKAKQDDVQGKAGAGDNRGKLMQVLLIEGMNLFREI
jgi:hypothetical protein